MTMKTQLKLVRLTEGELAYIISKIEEAQEEAADRGKAATCQVLEQLLNKLDEADDVLA